MASDGKFADVDLSIFKELKKLSGEKIRQARKALGLTQLEVATEACAGIARSSPAIRGLGWRII